MAEAEAREGGPGEEPQGRDWKPAVAWVCFGLAMLVVLASSLTVWVKRQVLDTDAWVSASSEVLSDPQVRDALSVYLVDQVYESVDVAGQLEGVFPPRLKPLAAPLAGALRDVGQRTVENVLAQPAAQSLWEDVNRKAHQVFTRLIDEEPTGLVQAEGEAVVLDLSPLVTRLKDRLGISGSLRPDAGRITIMTAQNLDTARTAVKAVKWVSTLAAILAIALLVAAMWLTPGRRRMLLWIGVGLVVIGLVLLIVRRVAGDLVVDGLVSSDVIRPAAGDVWLISTSLLHYIAIALIVYGALAVVGAVLAGPTRAARWVRARLAPVFRRPVWTYAGLGLILLLALWLGPNNSGRGWLGTLVLLGLLILGVEVLRRQTVAEFPEPAPAPA